MQPDIISSPNQTDGAAVMEKHATYYYDMVIFEVENVLFHIPKNGFLSENSKFFDQFDLKKILADDEDEVDSPSSTIVLKDVTSEALHGLLLVMYPFPRTASTYEEWLGALDLATKWEFPQIRSKAIDALSALHQNSSGSAVNKILLGRKFKVEKWLKDGYMEILNQADLKIESVQTLGWEMATRVFAAKWALGPSSNIPRSEAKCGNCLQTSGGNSLPCRLQCVHVNRQPRCHGDACIRVVINMFGPPRDCLECLYRCNDTGRQNHCSDSSAIGTQVEELLRAEKRMCATRLQSF